MGLWFWKNPSTTLKSQEMHKFPHSHVIHGKNLGLEELSIHLSSWVSAFRVGVEVIKNLIPS